MIQLRDAIAAPAHQRQHLASVRIKRHEGYLGIYVWHAELLVAGVQLVYFFVNHMDCGFYRRRGNALQVRIERSVDAQAFAVEVALAELLQQLLMHQVDEVGRLAGVHAHHG